MLNYGLLGLDFEGAIPVAEGFLGKVDAWRIGGEGLGHGNDAETVEGLEIIGMELEGLPVGFPGVSKSFELVADKAEALVDGCCGGDVAGGFEDLAGLFEFGRLDVFLGEVEVDLGLLAVELDGAFEGLDGELGIAELGVEDSEIGMGVGIIGRAGDGALGVADPAERFSILDEDGGEVHVGFGIEGADFDGFLVSANGFGIFFEILIHEAELIVGVEVEGFDAGGFFEVLGGFGVVTFLFVDIATGDEGEAELGVFFDGFVEAVEGFIELAAFGGEGTFEIIVEGGVGRGVPAASKGGGEDGGGECRADGVGAAWGLAVEHRD